MTTIVRGDAPRSFDPIPGYPLQDLRNRVGHPNGAVIHDLVNYIYFNRKDILNDRARVGELEKTIGEIFKNLNEDVRKTLEGKLPEMAKKEILGDLEFIELVARAIEFQRKDYESKLASLEKRVEVLEKKAKL